MTAINGLLDRFLAAFGTPEPKIPAAFVKIYRHGQEIPEQVRQVGGTDGESVMSCQAARHATHGTPVLLTLENVGCVAAAISLGLVDQHRDRPLDGQRVYTCIMREQAHLEVEEFTPPSPSQFTEGLVYACRDAGESVFCLFGEEDSGRFHDVATAKRAVSEMMAIQPAVVQGVFFWSSDFTELDITPDVVLLDVRPVELTRIIQGYAFLTGERLNASMGPVRAVNSDLIARPYLTGEINLTAYCLGSRLVAGFRGDRMGMGIPMAKFPTVVEGMEKSMTGYPYQQYPDARRD